MKKVFLVIVAAGLLLSSCRQDPEFDQLSSQFVVSTDYAPSINFKTGYNGVYYMPDTIFNIVSKASNTQHVQPWVDASALQLITLVESNMANLGYTRTKNYADLSNGNADLAITFIASKVLNEVFIPGWWDPYTWYWNGWYPPYYPWASVYSYTTGTEIINLVDFKNAITATDGKKKPSAVWSTTAFGALGTDYAANLQIGKNAVNQGFAQSPYLKRN